MVVHMPDGRHGYTDTPEDRLATAWAQATRPDEPF
jgi:hypothetical protein